MPKRFTETDKWKDKWFRSLNAEWKLAYMYVLDNCDAAGVIDLDDGLAEFQIGLSVDWDAFLDACGGRIVRLENGKLWIVKFIDYQYTKLSDVCKAHNPVFASIEKNGLPYPIEEREKGYPKGIQRVQDKDTYTYKDKDKEKDRDKEGVQGEEKAVPLMDSDQLAKSSPEFRSVWEKWKQHLKTKLILLNQFEEEMALMHLRRSFSDESDQIAAVEFSILRKARNLITNGDHKRQREGPQQHRNGKVDISDEELFSKIGKL